MCKNHGERAQWLHLKIAGYPSLFSFPFYLPHPHFSTGISALDKLLTMPRACQANRDRQDGDQGALNARMSIPQALCMWRDQAIALRQATMAIDASSEILVQAWYCCKKEGVSKFGIEGRRYFLITIYCFMQGFGEDYMIFGCGWRIFYVGMPPEWEVK